MAAPLLSVLIIACSQEPGDQSNTTLPAHAPSESVAMPPSIAETHTYRCDDDTVLIIDFLTDGTTLLLRRGQTARPTSLTAPAQGLDYVGDEASIAVQGRSIVLTEKKGRERKCVRA